VKDIGSSKLSMTLFGLLKDRQSSCILYLKHLRYRIFKYGAILEFVCSSFPFCASEILLVRLAQKKSASIALLVIKVEENAFLANFRSNSKSDSISTCVEICDNLVFPNLVGTSYFLGSAIAANTICVSANLSALSNLDLPCIRCTKDRFQ